jgi:hypothetical protein
MQVLQHLLRAILFMLQPDAGSIWEPYGSPTTNAGGIFDPLG